MYTAKSWALYADVLTNAIDVRDSELATQLDVDNAVTALTQAQAELVTLEEKLAVMIEGYESHVSSAEVTQRKAGQYMKMLLQQQSTSE